MFWTPTPGITLHSGSHIAVVGGGPAGSSFALFALHYAHQAGLDLHVTIFEPRDFTRPGPPGCNMCAGLIPMRTFRDLAEVGLKVPERIVRARIHRYTLHTAASQVHVSQPDPEGDVISVYRGQGPRCAAPWAGLISFDRLLLEAACLRGAQVIREPVTAITLRPRPQVDTLCRTVWADLVVLAVGVNRRTLDFTDLPYRPPPQEQMAQAELYLGAEGVQAALKGSVHIFLPCDTAITFGTLVPKGPCINVSLLGQDLPADSLQRFLSWPEVTALLPNRPVRACGCRPRIAVGPARPLFADRFVAVGDAGITRLYKDGIGTALRTARQAAATVVWHGIHRTAFQAHYAPLCSQIARDNQAGRLLFTLTRLFQHHPRTMLPHIRSVTAEQAMPPGQRLHSRLLWGMFTGVYPYRQLLAIACHPIVHLHLLRHLLGDRASIHQTQHASGPSEHPSPGAGSSFPIPS